MTLVGLFGDSFTVGEAPLRWRDGYFPFGLETETKPCNPLTGVFFSLFPAFYFFGGLFAICDLLGWGLTGFLHPGACSIHPSGGGVGVGRSERGILYFLLSFPVKLKLLEK